MLLASRCSPMVLVGALLAPGCASGPHVTRFDASARVLCPADRAVLTWSSGGEPAMTFTVEPAPDQDPACGRAGLEVFALTLVARKGVDEAPRTVELAQVGPRAAEPVALATTRIEGQELVAAGEKDAALWGGRLEVVSVMACGGEALEVRHEGRTVAVPAGPGGSTAFQGSGLGGRWELRRPLTSAERATPALRPRELKVLASLRCRPG